MTDPADLWADLSDNNGAPNLKMYHAAGHTRISLKVSQGTGYYWPAHAALTDEAHSLGMTVDHYHWLTPNVDAIAQADWFVNHLAGHLKPTDRVMTDFEETAGLSDVSDAHRANQLSEHTARVKATLPIPVERIVYAPNWYLHGKPLSQAVCRRFPIVASDYSGVEQLPNPYGLTYVAWQFTQTARVAGIPGQVDYNRSLIPEDDVSQADVIAALESAAGQAAIQKANKAFFLTPKDAHGKQVQLSAYTLDAEAVTVHVAPLVEAVHALEAQVAALVAAQKPAAQ